MKYLKSVVISVCLLLLCLPCARAEQIDWETANSEKVANPPQSVALEYRFIDNEIRRYDVTLAGVGTLRLPGQSQQTKLQVNSELTFVEQVAPKNTSDDIWHIIRKLVKGEMTIPDFGKLPVMVPQLDITMDKYGAVRTIKGLDQLSSTFGLPPDQGMADILSQLKFVGFPKKDLKVNDTWDDDYAVQLAGQKPITIKATSTLTDFCRVLKTDCATILTKYEVPFAFSLDTKDPKSVSDSKTSESAATQKPKAFVGKEKGEFRTYFSYVDGKIMQSYGTIELTADVDAGAKTADEKPADAAPAVGPVSAAPAVSTASDGKPATPAASAVSKEGSKHDLDVKYDVMSVFNPAAVKDVKQAGKGRTP
jgi:hypothetical protein